MSKPVPYESPKYFPFFHRDFMAGVLSVSATARGGYISLLCYQWDKKSIPGDDIAALGRIMGTTSLAQAKSAWSEIGAKFKRNGNGLWQNERLEEVRVGVEAFFATQKEKGQRGGRPKKKPGDSPGNPPAKPGGYPPAKPGKSHTNTNSNTGTIDLPGSKISPPSSDLSQRFSTEITNLSDAQTNSVEGWILWESLKELLDQRDDISVTGRSFFAKVYGATIQHHRLQLFMEDATMAQLLVDNWSAVIDEAMALKAPAGMQWRVVAKRRGMAKAKAS